MRRKCTLHVLLFAAIILTTAALVSVSMSGCGSATTTVRRLVPVRPTDTPWRSTTVPGSLATAGSSQPAMPTGAQYTGSVGWTLNAVGQNAGQPFSLTAVLVSVDPVTASAIAPPSGRDWILVEVRVSNRGTTPYVLGHTIFRMVDATGAVLAEPTELPEFLPPSQELPVVTLEPGQEASGALLYAVPSANLAHGTIWLGWEPEPSIGVPAKFAWSLGLGA